MGSADGGWDVKVRPRAQRWELGHVSGARMHVAYRAQWQWHIVGQYTLKGVRAVAGRYIWQL